MSVALGLLAQSVTCQIGNLTSIQVSKFNPQPDHIPFKEIGHEIIFTANKTVTCNVTMHNKIHLHLTVYVECPHNFSLSVEILSQPVTLQ